MAEVTIQCPKCHVSGRITEQGLGKTITCNRCGEKFVATNIDQESSKPSVPNATLTPIPNQKSPAGFPCPRCGFLMDNTTPECPRCKEAAAVLPPVAPPAPPCKMTPEFSTARWWVVLIGVLSCITIWGMIPGIPLISKEMKAARDGVMPTR